MSHYYFNRCPEEVYTKIKQVLHECGLDKIVKDGRDERPQWTNGSWKGPLSDNGSIYVSYEPRKSLRFPLHIQTSNGNHQDPNFKEVIGFLITICQPTQIFNEHKTPYNMEEFK